MLTITVTIPITIMIVIMIAIMILILIPIMIVIMKMVVAMVMIMAMVMITITIMIANTIMTTIMITTGATTKKAIGMMKVDWSALQHIGWQAITTWSIILRTMTRILKDMKTKDGTKMIGMAKDGVLTDEAPLCMARRGALVVAIVGEAAEAGEVVAARVEVLAMEETLDKVYEAAGTRV